MKVKTLKKYRFNQGFEGFKRLESCPYCERDGYLDTLSGIFEWMLDPEAVLIDKYTRLCFDCLSELRRGVLNDSE